MTTVLSRDREQTAKEETLYYSVLIQALFISSILLKIQPLYTHPWLDVVIDNFNPI